MTTTLTLHVRKRWFDEIKSGSKKFEYRLVTDYWAKRLEGRKYNFVVVCLGYPARGDKSRRLTFWWRGASKTVISSPEWGDIERDVYAIDLGTPTGRMSLCAEEREQSQ